MKQVLVKGGKVEISEVPAPSVSAGTALVRVSHSLISSGTESGFVSDGGTAGFIAKKARDPLNIEKVKRKLATVGLKGTIEVVRSKLFEFQAPGYSTSGVIVECGEDVSGFRVGDRVACSGVGYASHAEYNVVPHQLLTPIPDGVSFQESAFVTLGAIAMQGVRRIEPTFGETVVILGLGLLGQLAAQIARAAGCHVIGCDPIPEKQALARQLGAEMACTPDGLAAAVREHTAGYGADAVIVCAASKASGVTNQALDLCRQKGRVSVVGAVGLQLQREPLYLKELDFRLSCSYGPGRYNAQYEEKGLDYPIGYVRWTEGRNMAEFLRMVADGRVDVKSLISIERPVEDAQTAYQAVLSGAPDVVSALIHYGDVEAAEAAPPVHHLLLRGKDAPKDSIGFGLIGAGAIAQSFHLPNLDRLPGCHLAGVASKTGSKARQAADKHGAGFCTTDYRELLERDDVQAVLLATRHDLHTEIALAALEAGKHVFVEKPLALTVSDCEAICAAAAKAERLVTVGFNRRFSTYAQQARQAMAAMHGPKMLFYRCNAGALPPGHWATDPKEGGGRIVGEAAHFFDLCCWLLDAAPVSVRADRIDAPPAEPGVTQLIAEDNISALLRFPDGSLATVLYCTTGHSAIPKERIEIFGGGGAIVVDDYRAIEFAGVPGKSVRKTRIDKGAFGLLENFVQAIRGEADLSVTGEDGLRATRIACQVLEQARGVSSEGEKA